ncbi:MAG: penicillin-binding transpeptidase domain-containing protein [Myxococcota bacterium]
MPYSPAHAAPCSLRLLGRRCAALALAAVLLAVAAQADEPEPTQLAALVGDGTPPVSAGPVTTMALAAALGHLPPGVRPPEGTVILREERGTYGPRLIEQLPVTAPGGGAPYEIEYTVDPTIDAEMRAVLAEKEVTLGHVILMDPHTGEVFSYVSTDPTVFPATGTYPTASLMKVVTAAAVLQHAPRAAKRNCRWDGNPWIVEEEQLEPPETGGRLDSLADSLAISNNQCFARLAVHDLGEKKLVREMEVAGLFEPPAAHHLPGRVEEIEDDLALGYLGSGLGGSFVSPMAAARLAALFASGNLVQPYWVARVRDARGQLLANPPHPAPESVWPEPVAHSLRQWMIDVTARGTAKSAFRDEEGVPLLGDIAVAGKTGTLRGTEPEGRYQWFIGLAPAEAPRLAISAVVVNEEGMSSAAQVAGAALARLFCFEGTCHPARVERLHWRSRERDRATASELATQRAAREIAALKPHPRPRLLGQPVLDFPPRLRRRPVTGEMRLRIGLATSGNVVRAEVLDSGLPTRFSPVVLRQVRGWQFSQTYEDGEAIERTFEFPIRISIE